MIDEFGGSIMIDYETSRLREGEAFIIFVDGEEKVREIAGSAVDGEGYSLKRVSSRTFGLAKGEHLIQFSLESRIEPEVIISFDDVASEADKVSESLAEVAITRTTVIGSTFGGAFECKTCPTGSVSEGARSHCLACIEGSEANKQRSGCMPCKKGFYNDARGSHCKWCPDFTSSRRHDEEIPIYSSDGQRKAQETASTHCVLDDELHVLEHGQVYKAEHFKARKLCSAENYLSNANLCASQNIIGPISDLVHVADQYEYDLGDDDFGREDNDLYEAELADIEA